jgi:SAM-dependent methyltransferase
VRDDVLIQQRYGALTETYFWNTSHDDILLATVTPALRRLTAGAPGRPLHLLDVGCGPGNTLRRLAPWGTAFGVEYSETALGVARSRGVPRLVAGDGVALPFRDGGMDCVIASEVIEHIEDDVAALREIFRLLRPGGMLLLTVPAFMSLWRSHDRVYGHHRRYTRRRLLSAVGAAGFETERCEFLKCLYFFPLLVRAALDRARHPTGAGGDDFFQLPGWVNEALRRQIVWEYRSRLNRLLPFGVSLLWLGRRPE